MADKEAFLVVVGIHDPAGLKGRSWWLNPAGPIHPVASACTKKLPTFDALHQEWRKLKLPKNPDCNACGKQRF